MGEGSVITTKAETFLVDLAVHRYPECALFFVRQSGESEIGNNLLSSVVKRLKTSPSYNAVYSTSLSNLSSIKFSTEVTNWNRRGHICKIIVIVVDHFRSDFLQGVKR